MANSIGESGIKNTSRGSKGATLIHADSTSFREIVQGLTGQSKSGANYKPAPSKTSKPQNLCKEDFMGQKYKLPFKAGQSAEARSFEVGFRGAWFRCKIKEISRRRGQWSALLEYFDYPDEKLTWTELYQVPPYQRVKSEEMRQLMLRPQYPPIHLKSEVSDVSLNSDVTVIVDVSWKAGDLVDWWSTDCYWSGKVTKLLGNGKAEIELVPPPLGEGATYEVFVKDLRPSLDWSPKFGWAVPASLDGECCRQCAKLLQPASQGNATGEVRRDNHATAGSSSSASFSPRLSSNSLLDENSNIKTTEFVRRPSGISDSKVAENGSKDTSNQTSFASRSTHIYAKTLPPVGKRGSNSKELVEQPSNVAESNEAANTSKGSIWSDSDPVSPTGDNEVKRASPTVQDLDYSNFPLKKFKTSGEIRLNSTQCDSLEAAIMDLEELASKISWLKGIMECGRPLSDAVMPSWKFIDHYGTSTRK